MQMTDSERVIAEKVVEVLQKVGHAMTAEEIYNHPKIINWAVPGLEKVRSVLAKMVANRTITKIEDFPLGQSQPTVKYALAAD
ncbi:MAG TPA: hypothetical protein VNF00_00080 [Candidatus Acidoferrales bacterium]|nr:hypothetical protein [Candidatus Acidoferrales bacterium]